MAYTSADMANLAASPLFQNRTRQLLIVACGAIKNEGWEVPFHRERETFIVSVINQPEVFKLLFANICACDVAVITDATAAGAIPPTNADAYVATVTDAHLSSAIAASFNTFFRTPAN